MTARLPVVGGDTGAWGGQLNTYLTVGHNTDGTHPWQFNVAELGAKGDGHTNDQPIFQAAVNAAIAVGGGTVLVPQTAAGYLLSAPVNIDADTHGGVPLKVIIMGTSAHTKIYAGGFTGAVFNFHGTAFSNAYCQAVNLDIWATTDRPANLKAISFNNCLIGEIRSCQAFMFDTGIYCEQSFGLQMYNTQTFGCNVGVWSKNNGILSSIGGGFDTTCLALKVEGWCTQINFSNQQWDSDSTGARVSDSVGTAHFLSNSTGSPQHISFTNIRFGCERTPSQGNASQFWFDGAAVAGSSGSSHIGHVTFANCKFINDDYIAGPSGTPAAVAIEANYTDNLLLLNCESEGASVATFYLGANVTNVGSLNLESFDPALLSGPGSSQYAGLAFSNGRVSVVGTGPAGGVLALMKSDNTASVTLGYSGGNLYVLDGPGNFVPVAAKRLLLPTQPVSTLASTVANQSVGTVGIGALAAVGGVNTGIVTITNTLITAASFLFCQVAKQTSTPSAGAVGTVTCAPRVPGSGSCVVDVTNSGSAATQSTDYQIWYWIVN